jgi:hemoglobin-like flavoprotein
MTPQQIQLVRDGFDRLAPIAPEAATMFYNNLFAADPSLRQLFHADMASQGERLMGMIGTAVGMLDRPHALQPLLRRLGARHGGYGVRETHYATVGAALLLTLEQGLGAAFTPAAREAWTAMYGLVSRTMQEPATLQAEAA